MSEIVSNNASMEIDAQLDDEEFKESKFSSHIQSTCNPDKLIYSSPTRITTHVNSSTRSSPFLQHKINSTAINFTGTDKKYIYTNGDMYEGCNEILYNILTTNHYIHNSD